MPCNLLMEIMMQTKTDKRDANSDANAYAFSFTDTGTITDKDRASMKNTETHQEVDL